MKLYKIFVFSVGERYLAVRPIYIIACDNDTYHNLKHFFTYHLTPLSGCIYQI